MLTKGAQGAKAHEGLQWEQLVLLVDRTQEKANTEPDGQKAQGPDRWMLRSVKRERQRLL